MNRLRTTLGTVLILFLVGCESGELGMKITVADASVPASVPEASGKATSGKLTIGVAGDEAEAAQAHADAVAQAFAAHKTPEGTLTFTSFSIRNPSMEHPPRASAEISATCVWKESGKATKCFTVSVSTFSIEIENRDSQFKYLRDEAIKGMAKELADKL